MSKVVVKAADQTRDVHAQVVTCSGVHADGSLRVVRNGIGMIEQATVELSGEHCLATMSFASTTLITHGKCRLT